MFKGVNFIFNDIPSEIYGLKIGFESGGKPRDTFSGLKRSIEEYKIKRKSKPLFQGVEVAEKIEFDLLVYSEVEIDTYDRQFIDEWLFQNEYKYFRIFQKDYEDFFFKCIITESEKYEIGGIPYAKKLHFVCDDAYVYSDIFTFNYISTASPTTKTLRNLGNMNEYLYIEDMSITMTQSGSIKITNTSENNRIFEITGLSNGEILNINNENKILLSSTLNNRIGNFNKKWFRLVPNINNLKLEGNFNLSINVRFRHTI